MSKWFVIPMNRQGVGDFTKIAHKRRSLHSTDQTTPTIQIAAGDATEAHTGVTFPVIPWKPSRTMAL